MLLFYGCNLGYFNLLSGLNALKSDLDEFSLNIF